MAEIKKINIGGTEYDLEAVKATKDASGNVITDTYMTKVNPTGSGNVSIGRKSGSATGDKSVAIGENSIASASDTIAIGNAASATNKWAVAIGADAKASGEQSTAIGTAPNASGKQSLALGVHTNAAGEYSTAMGCWTNSNGVAGTSLGNGSTVDANSWSAVSSGIVTTARGLGQHVFGSYNIPDAAVDSYSTPAEHLMIVGNGDVLSDDGVQSNAMTLDWDGNAWFSGDVYVGSTSGTNKDAGSKKLATQDEITTYTLTKSGSTITLTGSDGSTTSVTDSSANGVTVDSALSSTSTNPVQNKVINSALAGKSDTGHIHNYVDKVTSTNKAITRFNGTGGAVQDSKIIIEDTTNDRDQSKGQVIAIPTTGDKKMVYGLCTDQVDGTAFIGGLFGSSTTSYPYAEGLAIGGSSGNLLWKGSKVATVDDLSGKANATHTHNYAGSSSAGGSATSAVKLDSSAGSATQPVYFSGGKPVATTYTLGASVPSGAKFTDTTYSAAGSALGLVKSGGDVTISSGVITVNDDSHNHTIANVDNLQTTLNDKADKSQGIFYIEGTGTTDTTNKVATWIGAHSDITEYYSGLTILYKVATAGSTTTTLNINDLGAVAVVRNATTAISTACPVSGVLLLTYTTDSDGTSYWKTADYDVNTKNTTGTSNKTGTKLYLAGATSQSSSGATTYSNKNVYIGTDNCLYSNGAKVSTEGHSQAASTISAGTFAGQVVAGSSYQTPGTALLRNSKLVTADTNPTNNGEICWTYA